MNILVLYFIFPGYAQVLPIQTPQEGEVVSIGKIKEEMGRLRSLKPSDFVRQIDDYRNIVEKFIEHKKRVCSGEFSQKVLGGSVDVHFNQVLCRYFLKKLKKGHHSNLNLE